jgi:hypothetical protein
MFERLRDRMEKRAIASAIILPVALAVVAFLGMACYFALRESLSPSLSALVTAAAGIVVIAVVLLVTRIATRVPQADQTVSGDLPDQIEKMLQENADPIISEWVRDNPDRAAIATLLLGVAAGYSESFQKVLLEMYSRYIETETRRRSDQRD